MSIESNQVKRGIYLVLSAGSNLLGASRKKRKENQWKFAFNGRGQGTVHGLCFNGIAHFNNKGFRRRKRYRKKYFDDLRGENENEGPSLSVTSRHFKTFLNRF